MTGHARHLGVHLPQIVTLGGGGVSGSYPDGTLQTFYETIGIRPRDYAPADRPAVTLKLQVAGDVEIPAPLTTAAADVVELGCWLNVQLVDHNPQHPGPDAGESEAEWHGAELPLRIQQIDTWLKQIGADRRMVLLSYGNERKQDAEAGGGLKVWNGQGGAIDLDTEWMHREGAFMEAVRDRLRCLPAFGNDISLVDALREMPRRLEVYTKWGVLPAAWIWHGYGVSSHHARHVRLIRATARAAGFQGMLIGGEVARRVDASAGNSGDQAQSGEWWRQYAYEVNGLSDVWACYFMLYEATGTPAVLAGFKAPVPTGASAGMDDNEIALEGWGIRSALLPVEERELDLAGTVAGLRAARDGF